MVWCDFVVLSVIEVCADYAGVNVFHVCLDVCVVYGVGVCVNVGGVVYNNHPISGLYTTYLGLKISIKGV